MIIILSWVILKGLKKEILFVSLRSTKASLFLAWWLFPWYRLMETLFEKLDLSVVIKSFPKNYAVCPKNDIH